MEYDWEKKITPAILREIQDLLPKDMHVIGLAVAEMESVEAALVTADHGLKGMEALDTLQDVLGDAKRIYETAINANREFYAAQTVRH